MNKNYGLYFEIIFFSHNFFLWNPSDSVLITNQQYWILTLIRIPLKWLSTNRFLSVPPMKIRLPTLFFCTISVFCLKWAKWVSYFYDNYTVCSTLEVVNAVSGSRAARKRSVLLSNRVYMEVCKTVSFRISFRIQNENKIKIISPIVVWDTFAAACIWAELKKLFSTLISGPNVSHVYTPFRPPSYGLRYYYKNHFFFRKRLKRYYQ